MESVPSDESLLSMGSDDNRKSSSSSEDSVFVRPYVSEKYNPYEIYEQKRPRSCCSTRSAALAALVVSILCLLLTIFGGCAVWLMNMRQRSNGVDPSEEVCLPCIQVNPDPLEAVGWSPLLDKLDRRYVEENDTEICCARTPAQYATLFKLILKRQEGVKKLADIYGTSNDGNGDSAQPRNSATVSAHLVIKPVAGEELKSPTEHPKQPWKSPKESPISHVRPGLDYHDNQIVVRTAGLYFVYCQILYLNGGDNTRLVKNQVASNYVKRTSILYPATSGILLKSRHTRYSPEQDRHSSYVGGLFFLHEGDVLFVQVALPQLVSHDDTASFFGLFRVGD